MSISWWAPAQAFPGGTITGRVTNAVGAPVADMQMEAFTLVNGAWTYHNATRTDANGSYALQVQQTTTYRVGAVPGSSTSPYVPTFWTHSLSVETGTDIAITADGQVVTGIDVAMSTGAHIRGRLTDKNGVGLAGVTVQAIKPDPTVGWITARTAVTDGTGAYDISLLDAGTFRVEFFDEARNYIPEYWANAATIDTANDIPLGSEGVVSGIDAVLAARSHITGRLTDSSGAPISHVFVAPYYFFNGTWHMSSSTGAYTDANGYYDVDHLLPNTYRLLFGYLSSYLNEFWDNAATVSKATDIVVGADVIVTGKNATLLKPSEVLTNKKKPTFSGVAKVGHTLTASPGTWTPTGATFAYQWLASGKPLAGATNVTYKIRPAAANRTIRVRVTASSPGLTSVSVDSSGALVALGTIKVVTRPRIKGTAKVGSTLTATHGVWRPKSVHLHYHWYADGSKIEHATGKRLLVRAVLAGHRITVKVRASTPGYTPRVVASAATGTVRHRAGIVSFAIRQVATGPL